MELTMTVIFLVMAGLSMVFWVIEAGPAWRKAHEFSPIKWNKTPVIKYIVNLFICIEIIPRIFQVIGESYFLIIDVTVTVLLTVLFGLGGNTGAAMGMTMSDVLSITLLIAMAKKRNPV